MTQKTRISLNCGTYQAQCDITLTFVHVSCVDWL